MEMMKYIRQWIRFIKFKIDLIVWKFVGGGAAGCTLACLK